MTMLAFGAAVLLVLWLAQAFIAWECRTSVMARVLGVVVLAEVLAVVVGVAWISFGLPNEPVEAPLPYIKKLIIVEGALVICGLLMVVTLFLQGFFSKRAS